MQNILSYLEAVPGLSAEDLESLAAISKPKCYEKDEMLFRAGEVCNGVFILEKGLVRCHYLHDDKEVNLRLLSEVSLVAAYSSYITQEPSIETVQAIEPCEGYYLSREDVDRLSASSSGFKELVLITAQRHYLSMERRLLTIQHKSVEDRLRYFLTHMEQSIIDRTPAMHVASYLGVPPESLSRAKRALNKNQGK